MFEEFFFFPDILNLCKSGIAKICGNGWSILIWNLASDSVADTLDSSDSSYIMMDIWIEKHIAYIYNIIYIYPYTWQDHFIAFFFDGLANFIGLCTQLEAFYIHLHRKSILLVQPCAAYNIKIPRSGSMQFQHWNRAIRCNHIVGP